MLKKHDYRRWLAQGCVVTLLTTVLPGIGASQGYVSNGWTTRDQACDPKNSVVTGTVKIYDHWRAYCSEWKKVTGKTVSKEARDLVSTYKWKDYEPGRSTFRRNGQFITGFGKSAVYWADIPLIERTATEGTSAWSVEAAIFCPSGMAAIGMETVTEGGVFKSRLECAKANVVTTDRLLTFPMYPKWTSSHWSVETRSSTLCGIECLKRSGCVASAWCSSVPVGHNNCRLYKHMQEHFNKDLANAYNWTMKMRVSEEASQRYAQAQISDGASRSGPILVKWAGSKTYSKALCRARCANYRACNGFNFVGGEKCYLLSKPGTAKPISNTISGKLRVSSRPMYGPTLPPEASSPSQTPPNQAVSSDLTASPVGKSSNKSRPTNPTKPPKKPKKNKPAKKIPSPSKKLKR
ncbi:MAG: hypothetical protein GY854_02105 [Deltaproteobacteria bacterium]|nr:hypothetical protein [Deltaproteobacteria bacterium]